MRTTPSAAASTAATQAFLAHRASNGNLSNAAAAAALRSYTTSPIPIAQIQTKRMQRRGSASSNGSTPDRSGLQRRDSNGSMTERTFRDPSPNRPDRPASSHGPYTRYEEPPPVPALPKGYTFQMPQEATRRAASVEPPERVSSPPPRLTGGRGVSLDRGPGPSKANHLGAKARVTSNLDPVGELDCAGSRGSVNFSRPMSPQNSSPTAPLAGGRVTSLPPTSSAAASLPSGEAERIAQSLQETASRPVKKTKKVVAKGGAEGSHLAAGRNSGPPRGTAVEATPPRHTTPVTPSPSPLNTGSRPAGVNEASRPKNKKMKKEKIAQSTGSQAREAGEESGSAYPSDTDSVTSERSTTTQRAWTFNTRAAGLLVKQPSIVHEEREAEEEAEKKLSGKKTNGQIAHDGAIGPVTPANTSKIVSKHYRSASQQGAEQAPQIVSLDVPGTARPQSLSPARAAHFSSRPEYENLGGTKHQPPARSVSPAKSALKHSPSRGPSPIVAVQGNSSRQLGVASSEASDTASNISDDGPISTRKKQTSVRVSFDDESITVGRAASPPMGPDSPVVMSPQSKPKSRSWFDLVREKNQEETVSDLDRDDVIKPTPTLPSFGSVRGRTDEQVLDSAKEQSKSEILAQGNPRATDTSTDQAIGSIIAKDALAKQNREAVSQVPQRDINKHLPPEVASVKGSGYHFDEPGGDPDQQQVKNGIVLLAGDPERLSEIASKEATSEELPVEVLPSEQPNIHVPSIAIQPATPRHDYTSGDQDSWFGMPGGFPSSSETSDAVQASIATVEEQHLSDGTPATIGMAEPEPEATNAEQKPGTPHVGKVAEGLRTQIESQSEDESEDTGNSIYSDAAEDPDDLEGDGFGSINAIAVSPTVPIADGSVPTSPSPKAPLVKNVRPSPVERKESELSEPASGEGWDRAQAYWSGLSQTRKQQLEQAAMPGAIDEPPIPKRTKGSGFVQMKGKKVQNNPTVPSGRDEPVLPLEPDRQYRNESRISASPKVPLKSSLRNAQSDNAQETHIRSSMRDGPPPKSSSRNGTPRNSFQPPPEPRGALQKKNRPVSAVAKIDYNKSQPKSTNNHVRAASAGALSTSSTPMAAQPKKKKPAMKPLVRRNDSDSSSSFKKAKSFTPSSNRYTMKRTMRPLSMDARPQSQSMTQSLGARTSSPAGSVRRRPFSSVGPGVSGSGMRTSMRDSINAGKPTRTALRASMDSKRPKSPSRFGFSKASKPKAVGSKSSSRFSSRFGDSSDEEDGRPTVISRYADSSDDEPTALRPVRGIPRRIDEVDSTDLEDSSGEDAAAPAKSKMNGVEASTNTKPEGVALTTGPLRSPPGDGPITLMGSGLQAKRAAEKNKKKRSIFGALGNKKRDEPPMVHKPDAESAGQRDMPLDRSKPERMVAPEPSKDERVLAPSSPQADPFSLQKSAPDSQAGTVQSSPKSPKLQRRNTPKRLVSARDISWPLSQSPGGATTTVDSRPRTSDGQLIGSATGRPELGTRRSTVQSEVANGAASAVTIGKTGKKKRFPMLRKAFGLHD